jgi:hypothetical protein
MEREENPDPPAGAAIDELLPEYDFSGGVRGKYAKRYADGVKTVLIDPEATTDSEQSAERTSPG